MDKVFFCFTAGFFEDEEIKALSAQFTEMFGGKFFMRQPALFLSYRSKGGIVYTPPRWHYTRSECISILKRSISSHMNIITEQWQKVVAL